MEEKDFLEQVMQVVINTIDSYYAGYGIVDMENDILDNVNELFLKRNPDAERYAIVGDFDGKPCKYCSNLCAPIANFRLKILQNRTFELWKNFRVKEQKN